LVNGWLKCNRMLKEGNKVLSSSPQTGMLHSLFEYFGRNSGRNK
jgi:hypothetical protein